MLDDDGRTVSFVQMKRLINSLLIVKSFQQGCGENEVGPHTQNSKGRASSTSHPVPVISGLDARGIGRYSAQFPTF